jgi:hypothetical protein
MFNNWIALSYEAARLGWEAQNVIMPKLAIGGAPAGREANRLMQEKIAGAASVAANAGSRPTAARKVLRVYKKLFAQTSVDYHGDRAHKSMSAR